MEKNNGKVIAIVALLVGVVALSVGFAAFSDTLTIDGSAKYESANAFDDATGKGLEYDSASPACVITGTNTSVATSPYSKGTASGDTWSGISVPLTKDNPSVTCTATVQNNTAYEAFLTGITTDTGISCTSSGDNKTTNETNICGATTVEVQVGSVATDKITFGTTADSNTSTTGSIAAKSGDNPGTATVTVKISYDPTVVADEDVTITLPTISHNYSSAR